MEPVTTSIVAALVAGAVAASKDVATAAIRDAYDALKSVIVQKYKAAAPVIEKIEKKPSDEAEHAALANQLQEGSVGADKMMQELAKRLLDAIAELKGDPKAQPLFDFDELDVARDMKMTNIQTIRQVVRATKAKVGQDFILDNVRDGINGPNR